MRNKIVIGSIVLLFLAVLLFAGKNIIFDLFLSPAYIKPYELSKEEKIGDFKYFFELIRDAYPFAQAIEEEKGLEKFFEFEEYYFQKVKESKNNSEFIILFREILLRLQQGTGHCNFRYPYIGRSKFEDWRLRRIFNISKKSFYLKEYWWDLLKQHKEVSHSDIETVYLKGKYITIKNYENGDVKIPKGSTIERIDNLYIDEYIKSLQTKIFLRYDYYNKKVYCYDSPFLVLGDSTKGEWIVEFKYPDNSSHIVNLTKKEGLKKTKETEGLKENVICAELNNQTGYIKVGNFLLAEQRKKDFQIIDNFLNNANGKYKKLIIDIRDNDGGTGIYWEDIFIKPLIKETKKIVQYSVVKKEIYNKLEFQNKLYMYAIRKESKLGKIEKIDREELPYSYVPDYINSDEYYFFRSTITYDPENRFPFNGKIYLVVDNNSFSSSENFVKTVKELNLATIVGANTLGGVAVVFAPWFFELPNSHIVFMLEIDLAFNSDGKINEIYGTKPDYELEPSMYPTSKPEAYDVESWWTL